MNLDEPKPQGIWCWGCGKRFVFPGTHRTGPLDSVNWREGLCSKPGCLGERIANGR